jgi:hypothetical protein
MPRSANQKELWKARIAGRRIRMPLGPEMDGLQRIAPVVRNMFVKLRVFCQLHFGGRAFPDGLHRVEDEVLADDLFGILVPSGALPLGDDGITNEIGVFLDNARKLPIVCVVITTAGWPWRSASGSPLPAGASPASSQSKRPTRMPRSARRPAKDRAKLLAARANTRTEIDWTGIATLPGRHAAYTLPARRAPASV